MSGIYGNNISPYDVKGGFQYGFGRDPNWWATFFIAMAVLCGMELAYGSVKRGLIRERMWPPWKFTRRYRNGNENAEDLELELWQEMERDEGIRRQLGRMARGEFNDDDDDEVEGVKRKRMFGIW
jgi:phospholipid-translocating ATPase